MWGDVAIAAMMIVANGLGAGLLLPQVHHLRRTRSIAGLSGAGIGVGIGLNLWWVAYGIVSTAPGIIPASAIGVLLYVTVAWALWQAGTDGDRRRLANTTLLAVFAPLIAVITGGIAALGVALGVAYTVQFAPAAIEATTAPDVSGISPTTWLMACGEAAIWAVYGLTLADVALVIGGIGGAAMAGIVLANTWRPVRTSRPTPPSGVR